MNSEKFIRRILNQRRSARLSYIKRTNISDRFKFLFLSHLFLLYFCSLMALLSVLGLRLWQVLYIYILFQTATFITLWFVCKIILNL